MIPRTGVAREAVEGRVTLSAVSRWLARLLAALALAGCAGNATPTTGTTAKRAESSTATLSTKRSSPSHPRPVQPSYPRLLSSASATAPTGFVPAMLWRGQPAAWIARSPSGIALLSFNQRLVALRLHSGTVDAGAAGWRFGPEITRSERRHLIAAFNGGFKLSTGAGGFMSFGHVAVPLRDGLGSIVTYDDGYTDVGSWHQELPRAGRPVASVRQNLTLLIDHGAPATTLGCLSCWGATLGGVSDPARAALGVTADGRLIWAGGEHVTVAQLAGAMLGARVVRAVELDINPEWVAGYLYGHRGGAGPLAAVPVVPGQQGIPGQLLAPYSRDFFSMVAR